MLQRASHAPELIAHRGMPRARPENSLDGFALALQAGTDGIELDVHATRDGVVVVHHDPIIQAPGGTPEAIAAHSLADLRARLGDAVPLPTLGEALELVNGAARVYVEIKAPAIERAVIAAIGSRSAWCAVHSFDHRVVRTVRQLAPAVQCGVLMTSYLVDPLAPLRDTGATDLWQHWGLLDEDLVAGAHRLGARVIAWTLNDASVARTFQAWGVDGFCSDDIRELQAL